MQQNEIVLEKQKYSRNNTIFIYLNIILTDSDFQVI